MEDVEPTVQQPSELDTSPSQHFPTFAQSQQQDAQNDLTLPRLHFCAYKGGCGAQHSMGCTVQLLCLQLVCMPGCSIINC